MKKCRLLRLIVVSLAITFLSLAWSSAGRCSQTDAPIAEISAEYIVYYFFMGKRCSTCLRIEEWSAMAVKDDLREHVEAGRLKWQALDIDEPENKHFVKDFQLYTKSVIVTEYKDGKLVRWMNLPDIWKLAHDQNQFIDYVAGKTRKFMENN